MDLSTRTGRRKGRAQSQRHCSNIHFPVNDEYLTSETHTGKSKRLISKYCKSSSIERHDWLWLTLAGRRVSSRPNQENDNQIERHKDFFVDHLCIVTEGLGDMLKDTQDDNVQCFMSKSRRVTLGL